MSDNILISLNNITKRYGNFTAVKGLTLQVKPGEIVGFLGPNGAGKSTTMKIITGYISPTSGQVLVTGSPVTPNSTLTREKIGYLPENAPLYDDMMVDEYLDFIGRVRHLSGQNFKERKSLVIERCGLQTVLGKEIGTLSKGYRQRVGLAQAIIHDPPILILDEPTSGLDPNQIVDIRQLIKELGREKTVLLSTHILPEVQATCNRVLIINNGQLVADDSPEKLVRARGGQLLEIGLVKEDGTAADVDKARQLLRKISGLEEIQDLAGEKGAVRFSMVEKEAGARIALFKEVAAAGLALVELVPRQLSLEDTFRQLTLAENEGEINNE